MNPDPDSNISSPNLLKFATFIIRLKGLKRRGWVKKKIYNPESVAEHSYGVALLAMILSERYNVNGEKAIKMALIHDLAESITGDIVIAKGAREIFERKRKIARERKALKKILSYVNKKEYIGLFEEYNAEKTKEARLVKQLDKFEMAIQALNYDKVYKIKLDSFYEKARKTIKDPYLLGILDEIEKQRL